MSRTTKHSEFIENNLNRMLRIESNDSWYKFKDNFLKDKTAKEMLEFYCIVEEDFFMLDKSTVKNSDKEIYKDYVKNKANFNILLKDCTLNKHLNRVVKRMNGLRFHCLHNKDLVQEYFNMYEKWYYEQGGLEEYLSANYHVNVIGTYIIKRTGGYWIVENEKFDKDTWFNNHRKETKSINNFFKTMYKRRLIRRLFQQANRKSFSKYINTFSYPNELVLRILKKYINNLLKDINNTKTISINQSYQLRDLIELGREDLLELANTTKKTFTHQRSLELFPMRSKSTKEKLRNIKINEKNKITIEEYSDDSFMSSIWNQFFIEEVDNV